MIEDDPFFYWRIAKEISVENAAILMVGGDPEAVDPIDSGLNFGDDHEQKRTTGHKGFQSALNALTGAILSGDIPVQIRYRPRNDSDIAVSRTIDLGSAKTDHAAKFFRFGNGDLRIEIGTINFRAEPDWAKSMVRVDNLRDWLRSEGENQGALFPPSTPETLPFMNPDHDHFAPELHFAITAWQALETQTIGKRGSKPVIEEWLDTHSHAWRGDGEVSATAKDRIAVVINWRRSGAPKSSG